MINNDTFMNFASVWISHNGNGLYWLWKHNESQKHTVMKKTKWKHHRDVTVKIHHRLCDPRMCNVKILISEFIFVYGSLSRKLLWKCCTLKYYVNWNFHVGHHSSAAGSFGASQIRLLHIFSVSEWVSFQKHAGKAVVAQCLGLWTTAWCEFAVVRSLYH